MFDKYGNPVIDYGVDTVFDSAVFIGEQVMERGAPLAKIILSEMGDAAKPLIWETGKWVKYHLLVHPDGTLPDTYGNYAWGTLKLVMRAIENAAENVVNWEKRFTSHGLFKLTSEYRKDRKI